MNKKILALFMCFIGISFLLYGCNKDSDSNNNTEDTTISTEKEGLKTGVYYMDNNMLRPCIVVTDTNIVLFNQKQDFHGKIYEYTASETVIDAQNSYSEITISIADDSLIYDGNTYTHKQKKDWFSENLGIEYITDPYVYYYALSEEDFNSASIAATEYYNSKVFIQDIISIELSDYIDDYAYNVFISDTERIAPGNIIMLDVITTTIETEDFSFEDYRYMTLTRTSKDSEWIVTNEGR